MKPVFPLRVLITSLPGIVIPLLTACVGPDTGFYHNYRILRGAYFDNYQMDSSVFYYDPQDRLVGVRTIGYTTIRDEVVYKEDSIEIGLDTYLLNNDGNISARIGIGRSTEFTYQSGRIIHERHVEGTVTRRETYFFYEDGNVIKDSVIFAGHGLTPPRTNVIRYIYTDTLAPEYMVHRSGLREIPQKSTHLPRSSSSEESGIFTEYTYEIGDDEIMQIARSTNTSNNVLEDSTVLTFRLEYNFE